jgi:hypothetical protein
MDETEETLKAFAEKYPKEYAKLLRRAEGEAIRRRLSSGTGVYISEEDITKRKEEIDAIIYKPDELHYLIQASDPWGTPHVFLEIGRDPDEAVAELERWRDKYGELTVLHVYACSCLACKKRREVIGKDSTNN